MSKEETKLFVKEVLTPILIIAGVLSAIVLALGWAIKADAKIGARIDADAEAKRLIVFNEGVEQGEENVYKRGIELGYVTISSNEYVWRADL